MIEAMLPKTKSSSIESLSKAQITQFRRDGVLWVPSFFSSDQMEAIVRFCDQVEALPEVPGRHMAYYEDSLCEKGKRVLSRIENFCPYHDGFDELLRAGKGPDCVGQLFGERAVLFKEKINFKMPGGDGFKAHQDVQAGWHIFAPLHITLLVSIDPATIHNGCLEVAKGHHNRGLLGAMWEPLAEELDGVSYEAVETQPGDAVFFDSYCPHRSAPNLTDQARRILYITYNAASAGEHRIQYYADKRVNYPPDCERDPGTQYRFKV